MTTDAPIVEPIAREGGFVNKPWANWFRGLVRGVFASLTVSDLTASRLVATDTNKKLVSVADFTAWVAGTALEVEITDNGDGTITVGLPDDVSITNDLSVLNDLSVTNDTTVGNQLTVADDSTLNGDVYIKKDKKLYFDNN